MGSMTGRKSKVLTETDVTDDELEAELEAEEAQEERKAKRRVERRPVVSQPEREDIDEGDIEGELKALFNSQSDITYKVAVLKYNPQTKTYPQVTSFTDITSAEEIPSSEEIGKTFGGGKYKILVSYAKDNGKVTRWSRVFELDRSYDKHLATPTAPVAPAGGLDSTQFFMMMMQQSEKANERMLQMQNENQKMMMGMMTALIPAMVAPKQTADVNTELLKLAIEGNKTDKIAEMKGMLEIMKGAKALAANEDDDDDEEDDEEEEEQDPKAQLMQTIMGAAGKVLGIQQPAAQIPQQQEEEEEDEYDEDDDFDDEDEELDDSVTSPSDSVPKAEIPKTLPKKETPEETAAEVGGND